MGDSKGRAAAGPGAVWQTVKEAARHTGLLRGAKLLARVNQVDGFDCPGCAWPEPAPGERSSFEFCENGAKAVAAEATRRRVDPAFFEAHSIPELLERSDHWLEAQGRLTHPMHRPAGSDRYVPVSWDDAFAIVGDALRALDDPSEAAFYTSGRTSNEAAFLYQLLARRLGTNNLPDCSNMCHESSGRGLGETIGIGKGTVGLHDFAKADSVFVIGQNPGTNHPRMLTALEGVARRGAKIVAINPLRERGLVAFANPQRPLGLLGRGTPISDLYLQVRVNGDVALLRGIAKVVLERGAEDRAFIDAHTDGFEPFAAAVAATSWTDVEAGSGLSRAEIEAAADVYCAADATIICWAMGLTQHKNGVDNIREVVNLLLLRGNIGRPGAGACPVRGHSNVQGDRTVGIVERPTAAFLDALGTRFDFTPPAEHGYDTVEAIHAMHAGRVRVFVAMGGNFAQATPDTDYTHEALRRCGLTVQISTKLNRGHLVTGEAALILPCLGRTETDIQATGPQFVTVENSMSIVSASRGRLSPASPELRSEPAIVAGLARAALGEDWSAWVADYDRVREHIEAVVPGFTDYNRRVREPGGFLLPNGARERDFRTATGVARFTAPDLPDNRVPDGRYLMITVRSHDQYNTTIYGLDDRYRGIHGKRRVVMLDPADIEAAGLREGQTVDLVGHYEGEERVAPGFEVVSQSLPRGCIATYFPEANVLVPARHVALGSNTPASKSVVVELRSPDA